MSSTELPSDMLRSAADLPARVAKLLDDGFRGGTARVRMSPELSYGRHAGPAPYTARRAAVILLLFQRSGRWRLPLTERPQTLTRHAGQISLPGGAVDPGETSSDAALRELSEELGIDGGVELVGRLADCYVYASDFLVTPWVAAATGSPQWRPHDREVQRIVEVPLESLLDEEQIGRTTIVRGPLRFHAPCHSIEDTCIWGATSVILSEFAEVLQLINRSFRQD
jgi:8-oxo-dGTP pyrophosphatase MutT (NUDIX family)